MKTLNRFFSIIALFCLMTVSAVASDPVVYDNGPAQARLPDAPQAPTSPLTKAPSVDRPKVTTLEPPRTLFPTSTKLVDAPSEFRAYGSQCDADGNIYLHMDSTIIRLSTSDKFALYKLTSDYTNQFGEMSVAQDGTLWLALFATDATTLMRFNSDGEVTSHVRLDLPANLVPERFAAFDNGVFFIEGHFARNAAAELMNTRYTAMVNVSGQVLSILKLDLPDFDPGSKTLPESAASAGSDGNLYFLSSHEVVVVSQSGEILRQLRFNKPDSDYIANNMSISGGLVAIWFAKTDEQHRITTEFLVIEAMSGEERGRYSMGKELGHAVPVCFSRQDGFTFLGGIKDGKMKLITAALQ